MIATADCSNDHVVTIHSVSDKSALYSQKGGPDKIHDICFHKGGEGKVWTAGVKHLGYHDTGASKMKKGLFGNEDRTSMACITADDQGNAYSGGANGQIYVWGGNTCKQTLTIHDPSEGFVGAIMWLDGKLYSGGKDGRVNITDTASMTPEKTYTFGNLIRAIDVFQGKMVCGLMTGSIIETDLGDDSQTTLVQSHNQGEVWGLDI